MHMTDLAGKTAFVTGAASGIGLEIAAALAQAGSEG
jgi:NAD(P)-dependent dehydrogenase (short-subunit alcohol dehydrogenase family)